MDQFAVLVVTAISTVAFPIVIGTTARGGERPLSSRGVGEHHVQRNATCAG